MHHRTTLTLSLPSLIRSPICLYATNSLIVIFKPINLPTASHSLGSTPNSHVTGINILPNTYYGQSEDGIQIKNRYKLYIYVFFWLTSNDRSSNPTKCPNHDIIALMNATNDTNATMLATIAPIIFKPNWAPLQAASITLPSALVL